MADAVGGQLVDTRYQVFDRLALDVALVTVFADEGPQPAQRRCVEGKFRRAGRRVGERCVERLGDRF